MRCKVYIQQIRVLKEITKNHIHLIMHVSSLMATCWLTATAGKYLIALY